MATNCPAPPSEAKIPALPPPADFETARDQMAESFTEVERVQWALNRYSDTFNGAATSPASPPDDAYVGALYRFVDDVETRAKELTVIAARLRRLLVDVDCIGRDAAVREEQAGRG